MGCSPDIPVWREGARDPKDREPPIGSFPEASKKPLPKRHEEIASLVTVPSPTWQSSHFSRDTPNLMPVNARPCHLRSRSRWRLVGHAVKCQNTAVSAGYALFATPILSTARQTTTMRSVV